MPTIPLAVARQGPDLAVDDLNGGVLDVPRPQFRCLLDVPQFLLPVDAIVDTGAPLTIFPSRVWTRLQLGTDYEFLPFIGSHPPPARVAGWQFDFHIARFLVPLALLDSGLTTRVPRAGVVAKFAVGDPQGWRSLPPVLLGLWGGLLEGGRIGIDRDPYTNRATGELVFP